MNKKYPMNLESNSKCRENVDSIGYIFKDNPPYYVFSEIKQVSRNIINPTDILDYLLNCIYILEKIL